MPKTRKRLRKMTKAEETKLSSALGGRRTFNSGAGNEKGDARASHSYQMEEGIPVEQEEWAFRIESKLTGSTGYRLSARDWEELEEIATPVGEVPVFVIRFKGALRGYVRLAVIPTNFARNLLNVKEPTPPLGRKTKKFTHRTWLTESATEGVPHVRFSIDDHDLTALEWAWFCHCTCIEETD